MEIFTNSVDLARIAFLIGAAIAMVYKKQLGITPGGIIVPAFLAILLDQNVLWFFIILAIALVTRLTYNAIFESHALRRGWVVFTNICISAVLVVLTQLFFKEHLPTTEAVAYGFAIPGLIGANAVRYGTAKVFQGTLFVTALAYLAGVALANVIPTELTTQLTSQLSAFAPLKLNAPQIFLPAGLAVTGLTMWKYGVRTGGYLLAPFVAMLATTSPLQMAGFMIGIIASYIILQFILRHSLIVGLERFMLCLFLAAVMVSGMDLLAVGYDLETYLSTGVVLMVSMGVIVNDLCLQRDKLKALSGVSVPVALSYGLRLAVR